MGLKLNILHRLKWNCYTAFAFLSKGENHSSYWLRAIIGFYRKDGTCSLQAIPICRFRMSRFSTKMATLLRRKDTYRGRLPGMKPLSKLDCGNLQVYIFLIIFPKYMYYSLRSITETPLKWNSNTFFYVHLLSGNTFIRLSFDTWNPNKMSKIKFLLGSFKIHTVLNNYWSGTKYEIK